MFRRRGLRSKHAMATAYGGSLFGYLLLVAHINVVNYGFVASAAALSGYLHGKLIGLTSGDRSDQVPGSRRSSGFGDSRRTSEESAAQLARPSALRHDWKVLLFTIVVLLIVACLLLNNRSRGITPNDKVWYSFILYILCDVRFDVV